jgi:hypothetical protein
VEFGMEVDDDDDDDDDDDLPTHCVCSFFPKLLIRNMANVQRSILCPTNLIQTDSAPE